MTMQARDPVRLEAADWLLAVNDPDFHGWDEWEAWLAADSAHAAVYWTLAAKEQALLVGLQEAPQEETAGTPATGVSRRRRAIAALVACLLLTVGMGTWFVQRSTPRGWTIATAPGEQRSVLLADGSRVHLNGGTRLAGNDERLRSLTLEAGEAVFEVEHDPARPYGVRVGDGVVRDIGTIFSIARDGDVTRVAVAEGAVRYEAAGRAERLTAGDRLIASARQLRRGRIAPEDVGGFRRGRLTYENVSLTLVAADLGRALGVATTVDPGLVDARFTGSIRLGGSRDALRDRLEPLLGVRIDTKGGGWQLAPASPR